jgi:adenine-specific DNA-methyltransferase
MAKPPKSPKKVDALKHEKARRINVPTAELQSLAEQQEEADPLPPGHFVSEVPSQGRDAKSESGS